MLGMLLATALSITSYDNVSYETYTFVPAHYVYEAPINGIHYIREIPGEFIFTPINGWQVSDPGADWMSTTYEAYWGPNFPDNARKLIADSYTWIASGNVGTKSLAEFTSLQADVTAGTKRNLVGTPVYG
ncbi:hypothetical protein [Leptospira ilyithenensis]|uniref:Uncharacterized protein n=1 Tax=Leptospira ilyithenensis TaxID=2484901 RepID=A0A4V3JWZ9_9LEPT|nr:hypothetical protein [Leptospira ilyithenensis]TGN09764.1 hypothetical protein EHS11_11825 [Leptospira ilyithenensis]